MTASKFDTDLDAIPWCDVAQHAAARAYLEKHAPDLIAVILGSDS